MIGKCISYFSVHDTDAGTTPIRKIIYTTNTIEGLHRQFRKVTKTKAVFPNDDALRKMLYLASNNIVKKWTQLYRDWDMVLNHLAVLYEGRCAG